MSKTLEEVRPRRKFRLSSPNRTGKRRLPMGMFEYSYRAWDRHRQRVASIAILTDTGPRFRPDQFGWKLWGTEMGFRYP